MIVKLKKTLMEGMGGQPAWRKFGVSAERMRYADTSDLDLGELNPKKLKDLEAVLLKEVNNRTSVAKQANLLLIDVQNWRQAISTPATVKPKTVAQFEGMLKQFMIRVPGQRLFERNDDGTFWCYYVGEVDYIEPHSRDRDEKPYVTVDLHWEEQGTIHRQVVTFYAEGCRNMLVGEALAKRGYFPETDALRQAYLTQRERYGAIYQQVGTQFLASGVASSYGVDGNRKIEDDLDVWSSWRYTGHEYDLERGGAPSRVVLDVFSEAGKTEQKKDASPDPWFWKNVHDGVAHQDQDDGEDDIEGSGEDQDDDAPLAKRVKPFQAGEPWDYEIPVHTTLIVFDLAKHLRVKVHVTQLADYVYDQHLADKLVLADERKQLVKMLVDTKAGVFQDIVRGKAGGAVVLLAGPPGTGKTLTAEVYAESEGRALYSVQCSQLGVDPDYLEKTLLKVFDRARRWNAVLLLDEADVYVRQRSNDLMQNAIVGVFLRVLEYQATVMFLTTNRPDDVDDAIASRCIAKLTYEAPTTQQQFRIWQVLTAAQGIELPNAVIDEIVDDNRNLSGRDVKNLLKLAQMHGAVNAASVRFVRQFKPTSNLPKAAR